MTFFKFPFVLAALLPLGLPALAAGKTSLSFDIGWGGLYRSGRWAPIYITAADDQGPARNVFLQITAPHDVTYTTRIEQALTLRPEPTTFVVYVPMGFTLGDAAIQVRDAATFKLLNDVPLDTSPNNGQSWNYGVDNAGDRVIGLSGNRIGLPLMDGGWELKQDSHRTRGGYLPTGLLPDVSQGYDSLDVLVLGAPDLLAIDPKVQLAIADWVRAGGKLLIWLGDSILPPDSPIVRLLPCTVGEPSTLALPEADARKLGLVPRVTRLATKTLAPLPGAQSSPVLLGKAQLWKRRAGFGEVALLSFDASQLIFNNPNAARELWSPILADLLPSAGNDRDRDRDPRAAAMQQVINRLGDVPGVGTFDFRYIAFVLGAMMLIVGPVDWFVLRKLGRQPWTWATTAGWIGLVTAGALYLGHVMRSGDLHFRTVHVIDQADGRVVAARHVAGIYSPRTQLYAIDGPRESWWEPANMEVYSYSRRRRQSMQGDMRLSQDSRGCRPSPLTINVWNLRFMEAADTDLAAQTPILKASLKRTQVNRQERLVGTITNTGPATLRNIYIQSAAGNAIVAGPVFENTTGAGDDSETPVEKPIALGDGVKSSQSPPATLPEIKPGQTISVDVLLRSDGLLDKIHSALNNNYSYGHGSNTLDRAFVFGYAACELGSRRSQQATSLLAGHKNLVLICAEGPVPASPLKLNHSGSLPAVEKHWQVVRALVEIE